MLLSLTNNYVNADRYGIWLAISSIVAWFSIFDIGLTQGLRNKFAAAKAEEDDEGEQVYVAQSHLRKSQKQIRVDYSEVIKIR